MASQTHCKVTQRAAGFILHCTHRPTTFSPARATIQQHICSGFSPYRHAQLPTTGTPTVYHRKSQFHEAWVFLATDRAKEGAYHRERALRLASPVWQGQDPYSTT